MPVSPHLPNDGSMAMEYERLRANALGETNRAFGLALFLRAGMVGWLRAVAPSTSSGDQAGRSTVAGNDGSTPARSLATVLVDALLSPKSPRTLGART